MQQAIDILDEMIKSYDHKMYLAFCGNPAIEIDKEAKAKLIEAKSRISALGDGWIKIGDEFPEDNTEVLVCDDEGIDISQGFAYEHSGTWLWLHSRRKFTHWMPLPNSPKQ